MIGRQRNKLMRLTKSKLKQIIKEELEKIFEADMDGDGALDADELRHMADKLSGGDALHAKIKDIADWMEDNHIYKPEEGIDQYLEDYPEHEDKRDALMDMADEIYEYM